MRSRRADTLHGRFGSDAHQLNFTALTFVRGLQKPKSGLEGVNRSTAQIGLRSVAREPSPLLGPLP